MIAALRLSETTWWKSLFVAWAVLIAMPAFERIIPASYWFTVDSVHVFDTQAGADPVLTVKRHITRPFKATWLVEVERETSKKTFFAVCTGQGTNLYRTDNELPEGEALNLEWWIGKRCNLRPGRYRIDTQWTFVNQGGQAVRAVSNVFTVHP